MTTFFKIITALAAILLVSITVISCRKDHVHLNPAGNRDKYLNIILEHNYLTAANVDSAFVQWEVNGNKKTIQLATKGDTLFTKLASLQHGTGVLTIRLFTKNKLGNNSLQYESRNTTTITHSGNVNIAGPAAITDMNWKPRVIFLAAIQSATFNINAVVGIRPTDPYFELIHIDEAWRKRIFLERSYFYSPVLSTPIATGVWDCQVNCLSGTGSYVNTSFFSFLAQQVNNRTWNRVEVTLRLYNTPTFAGELNFDYNF
jgi:hypothetical protein